MAAARVVPRGRQQDAFIVLSLYGRWTRTYPITGKWPRLSADLSVHRILTDMQTFIDYANSSRYCILPDAAPWMLVTGEIGDCLPADDCPRAVVVTGKTSHPPVSIGRQDGAPLQRNVLIQRFCVT